MADDRFDDVAGSNMQVAVVGAGHVGLVTAAGLAKIGHQVTCIESDAAKMAKLTRTPPALPIYEPGLQELVQETVASGRLSFCNRIQDGISEAQIVFICVGTPQRASGEANLHFVESVASEIARNLDSHKVIVEKSTVPVKTGEQVRRTVERVLARRGQAEIPFDVVPRLPQEEAARGRLPIHQPTAAPSTAPKVAAPPAPLQDHEIPPAGEFTGAHLLRWRRGLKLSQRPAAQRLGISQGWLSKTEKALTERVGPKLQDALERELGPHRQQHSAAEGPNQPHELPTQ